MFDLVKFLAPANKVSIQLLNLCAKLYVCEQDLETHNNANKGNYAKSKFQKSKTTTAPGKDKIPPSNE